MGFGGVAMNRRGFLGLLGKAAAGAAVAYSFPSIIVPQNAGEVVAYDIETANDLISELNLVTRREIFPRVINDCFFSDSPFLSYLRSKTEPLLAVEGAVDVE